MRMNYVWMDLLVLQMVIFLPLLVYHVLVYLMVFPHFRKLMSLITLLHLLLLLFPLMQYL